MFTAFLCLMCTHIFRSNYFFGTFNIFNLHISVDKQLWLFKSKFVVAFEVRFGCKTAITVLQIFYMPTSTTWDQRLYFPSKGKHV